MAGQGDGVGLVVYDDTVRQFIPSRTGRSHLRQPARRAVEGRAGWPDRCRGGAAARR